MGKAKIKTIDEAWLGLDSIESDLFNPMSVRGATDDDFNLHLSWLLTRPEYLSFITHHILNIQLLPSQALFLKEVWNRKFPMLIASRGFGKSFICHCTLCLERSYCLVERLLWLVLHSDSPRCFLSMETIWRNSPMLRDMYDGDSGPRRDTDRCTLRLNDNTVTCLPLGDGQKN